VRLKLTQQNEEFVPASNMLPVLGLILDKLNATEVRLTTMDYILATGITEVFYDHETMEWVIKRVPSE
jgi:hypothetical protein